MTVTTVRTKILAGIAVAAIVGTVASIVLDKKNANGACECCCDEMDELPEIGMAEDAAV